MELTELQRQIRVLANLKEADEPVVNCYLNLGTDFRRELSDGVRLLRGRFEGQRSVPFWEAVGRIDVFVGTEIRPQSKGVAIFARGGERPFFLPLQFGAPLPNSVTRSATPHIYHLVALKDNYHRYVVMLSSEESARILEVNVGTVTEAVRRDRPDLRQRAGREWTKEHLQSHRQARTRQFINEQVKLLDGVVSAGGHRYLILAGEPWMTSRIQRALPRHLSSMLISAVRASGSEKTAQVVESTLPVFAAHEERESLAVVDRLHTEMSTRGLAVAGTLDSLRALKEGRASLLVLSAEYPPTQGWSCSACGDLVLGDAVPGACAACGNRNLLELDMREELVRVAEQNNRPIEIAEHSDGMKAFGGVGCLLRYQTRERSDMPAA